MSTCVNPLIVGPDGSSMLHPESTEELLFVRARKPARSSDDEGVALPPPGLGEYLSGHPEVVVTTGQFPSAPPEPHQYRISSITISPSGLSGVSELPSMKSTLSHPRDPATEDNDRTRAARECPAALCELCENPIHASEESRRRHSLI